VGSVVRGGLLRALAAICAVAGLLALPGTSLPAVGDVGYQDQSFSGTSTPTGTKRAESVLWWNHGSWWASMWDATSQDFHIHRLDVTTQTWIDTGVAIDTRANTHADVLWDGSKLYVASHEFVNDGEAAVSGPPSYLFRFSYDAGAMTYSLDAGFPVVVNTMKTETLVIDKDSTGKLWATWQQGNRIYVNRTLDDDRTWGTPFVLPVAGTSVTVDDNSAVVAFGGNKLGVMWSNQTSSSSAMYFAVHVDGQPDSTWEASRTAIQGPDSADDHMNLKSLQADGSGRVFAAVKTEFTSSSAPLIMLLVRDPATGDWTSHPIARVAECPNRPIVVIDEENRVLHAFYTAPAPPVFSCTSSGGAIYEKTSSLDAISFPTDSGTAVILDADSTSVHNVSASKQNVTTQTGLVVLAVNNSTRRYWHHYDPLGPPPPPPSPIASFTGSPLAGESPLDVQFTDTSTGSPTSWSWSFGDGATSTERNPIHLYASAGSYSVTLAVSNASGSNTATKTDYITVTDPAAAFVLSATPTSMTIARGESAKYTIAITPTNGFSGTVTLSATGLPGGAGASFSPNPVNVSAAASSELSVATSSTTKNGKYTLTIVGVSDGITRTTSVTLQVRRR
jgi:PKD repeat protein